MATATPPHHEHHPFHDFDQSMERTLGADMRLLYGLGVPVLMIVGLLILLGLSPAAWLVGVIVALEVAGLGLIVYGIYGMIDESDQDEDLPESP